MRKTFDSALTLQCLGFSDLKIALLERALVVCAVFFWIAALPFVALSLRCVEIWDKLTALKPAADVPSNPIILRHALAKSAPATPSFTRTTQS